MDDFAALTTSSLYQHSGFSVRSAVVADALCISEVQLSADAKSVMSWGKMSHQMTSEIMCVGNMEGEVHSNCIYDPH